MKHQRQALIELREIAHDLKHFVQWEKDKASITTKQRVAFKDIMERVDRLYDNELKRGRKDDGNP